MASVPLYEGAFWAVLLCVPYLVLQTYIWTYIAAVIGLYCLLNTIRSRRVGRLSPEDRGVFITGCDTGFGHDVARRLDKSGFTVFAGCLHSDGEGARRLRTSGSARLHVLGIDVTSEASVEEALDYVKQHLPAKGLWGVVCNAGIMVMGDAEFLTADMYLRCTNVNFLGAVRVVRSFLPLIRNSKGRFVFNSSVRGQYPMPGASAYHASKWALETYADTLRLEMVKFSVKVSVIQPGMYGAATSVVSPEQVRRLEKETDEMWACAKEDVRSVYGKKYLEGPIVPLRKGLAGPTDTGPVTKAMEEALVSEDPQTRYIVGGGDGWIDPDAMLARCYGKLPTWLTDWHLLRTTGCGKFPDDSGETKYF